MKLALFERMEVLAKAARTFSGMPVERSDKTGTAMLFEDVSARAGRPSSAAAENTKDLWRPAIGGENRLERENRKEHYTY